MATIQQLVDEYVSTRSPGWIVLDAAEVLQLALQATRFYAAYGPIRSIKRDVGDAIRTILAVSPTTVLGMSEWGIILPLFSLYVEKENAYRLEASRAAGAEPYGRAVSEIQGDIAQMEANMPQTAFVQPVRILGYLGGDELPPAHLLGATFAGIPLLPADGA